MSKKIGVTGSSGYIGSNLCSYLQSNGHDVRSLGKNELPETHFDAIIYCAGKTGNYLDSPLDTIEAHVNYFGSLLKSNRFEHIIYLSSIRLYDYCENDLVPTKCTFSLSPFENRNIFDLTKMTGEWLAIHHPKATVARIASVFGGQGHGTTFLQNLFEKAMEIKEKGIVLNSRPELARYYIPMALLCQSLESLACSQPEEKVYDMMVSKPVSNTEIADLFSQQGLKISFCDEGYISFLQQKEIKPASLKYIFTRTSFDFEFQKELKSKL
jgi:UDP-glucose 4-epimerase